MVDFAPGYRPEPDDASKKEFAELLGERPAIQQQWHGVLNRVQEYWHRHLEACWEHIEEEHRQREEEDRARYEAATEAYERDWRDQALMEYVLDPHDIEIEDLCGRNQERLRRSAKLKRDRQYSAQNN